MGFTLKILHLANFYNPQSGGIKTYLDNKRLFLAKKGLPFRLVIPGEQDDVAEAEPDTVIYRIGSPKAPINPIYRIIINLGTVHQIVKMEKPDILEVNDKFTLMALSYFYRKIQKRLPTAGFHHERLDVNMRLYFGDGPIAGKLANLYMQIFAAAFDRIICASRFTAGEIEPISPEKTVVMNLGIDLERFQPRMADGDVRRRFARGADALLLYVGRIAKEKNVSLLPRVMDKLAEKGVDARLVVAGVGPEVDAIKGERIDLLGYISDRVLLAKLYASSDVFVFPSKDEPYGLVPLEALSAGLPVVCPDSGGVLEYSDSDAVRSIAPTAEGFAEAIIELTGKDQEILRSLARKQAERFPWSSFFERQLALYEEMIRIGVTRPARR